jgi:hypothetical protein
MLLNVDAIYNGECPCLSHKLISAPELSKHLTTSQCPENDASNNGDLPSWSYKMISAPELSKHLTTSHSYHHVKENVMLLNVY